MYHLHLLLVSLFIHKAKYVCTVFCLFHALYVYFKFVWVYLPLASLGCFSCNLFSVLHFHTHPATYPHTYIHPNTLSLSLKYTFSIFLHCCRISHSLSPSVFNSFFIACGCLLLSAVCYVTFDSQPTFDLLKTRNFDAFFNSILSLNFVNRLNQSILFNTSNSQHYL